METIEDWNSVSREELFEIFGDLDTVPLERIRSVIDKIISAQQGAFG